MILQDLVRPLHSMNERKKLVEILKRSFVVVGDARHCLLLVTVGPTESGLGVAMELNKLFHKLKHFGVLENVLNLRKRLGHQNQIQNFHEVQNI